MLGGRALMEGRGANCAALTCPTDTDEKRTHARTGVRAYGRGRATRLAPEVGAGDEQEFEVGHAQVVAVARDERQAAL